MRKLVFVYNADAGFFNMVTDMAHKIFSPATYPCSLCDLTYGIFKIRPEWDDFVKNAPLPMTFLHKDEFQVLNPAYKNWPLPCVFQDNGQTLSPLITAKELTEFQTIDALKSRVLQLLNAQGLKQEAVPNNA